MHKKTSIFIYFKENNIFVNYIYYLLIYFYHYKFNLSSSGDFFHWDYLYCFNSIFNIYMNISLISWIITFQRIITYFYSIYLSVSFEENKLQSF